MICTLSRFRVQNVLVVDEGGRKQRTMRRLVMKSMQEQEEAEAARMKRESFTWKRKCAQDTSFE